MVDELLPYYDRELSYLRRLAEEFAQAHPEAAGQLRISPDTIEDPHVARLMEATAFLNARIRRVDGQTGAQTTEAIRAYERDKRLLETGQSSQPLLTHMLQSGG